MPEEKRPSEKNADAWKPEGGPSKIKIGFRRITRKFHSPSIEKFCSRRRSEIEEELEEMGKTPYPFFNLKTERFELPAAEGKNNEPYPSKEYQKKVRQLFEHLAAYRIRKWETADKNRPIDIARQHALVEVGSLRSEIVDIKSQVTSSERVTAAWMVGAVFAYNKEIISFYPILFMPLFLSVFGFLRLREFQRNIFDLDCYLREIEVLLRPDSGWVSYFFRTREMHRFFVTRVWFWSFSIFLSVTFPIFGWFDIFSPQAIRIDLFTTPKDSFWP